MDLVREVSADLGEYPGTDDGTHGGAGVGDGYGRLRGEDSTLSGQGVGSGDILLPGKWADAPRPLLWLVALSAILSRVGRGLVAEFWAARWPGWARFCVQRIGTAGGNAGGKRRRVGKRYHQPSRACTFLTAPNTATRFQRARKKALKLSSKCLNLLEPAWRLELQTC